MSPQTAQQSSDWFSQNAPPPTLTPPGGSTSGDWFSDNAPGAMPQATASATKPPAPANPLMEEFAHAMGYSGPDIGWADFAHQTLGNFVDATKNEFRKVQASTGEQGKPVLGSPYSLALTPPSMLATGVEGLSSLVESSVGMFQNGIRNWDGEQIERATGKLLAAGLQARMLSGPEGKGMAQTAAEYSPKSVAEAAAGTGSARPFNVLRGPINRSLGAMVRDVRYGDPSQALVDNGITSPTTTGRLAAVAAKVNDIAPRVTAKLATVPQPISVWASIQPIIQRATQNINDSFEMPAAKANAIDEINNFAQNVQRLTPNGASVPADIANTIKQRIGDMVNWEQRPTPMLPEVSDMFRRAYGAIKQQINSAAPDVAKMNDNLSNLLAARNALTQNFHLEAIGQGPLSQMAFLRRAEAMVGHVAPAGIMASQGAAALVPPIARATAVASTQSPALREVGAEFERVGAGRPAALSPSQASTIQTAIRGPRYKSLATDEQRNYLQSLLKKSGLRLPGG